MRIKRLAATGLKAAKINDELGPVTIIAGPNATGKSARFDAIRLALLGYSPELGKTVSGTTQLANGSLLAVSIEFDQPWNGKSTVEREWTYSRGKWTRSGDDEVPIPTVLLDPSTYFSLGAKERVRYVFGLCESSLNPDAVIAEVKNCKVENHTEDHEQVIREVVNLLDKTDRERHELDGSIQEWLREQIATVKEKLKVARAHADRMAKTVQGLAVVAADENDAGLKAAKAQYDQLQKECNELNAKLSAADATRAGYRQQIEKRDKLAKQLVELKAADNTDLRKRIETLRAVPKPDLDKFEEIVRRIDGIVGKAAELKYKLNETRRKIAELRENAENFDRMDKCPVCGTLGSVWKPAKLAEINKDLIQASELESVTQDELDKINSQLEVERKERARLADALAEYEKAIGEAERLERSLKEGDLKIETVTASLKTFPEDLDERYREAHEAVLKLVDQHQEALKRLNGAANQYEAALSARERARTEAKTILESRRAKAEVEAYAAVVKILETIQEKAVETAIGGLLERVNSIAGAVLDAPLTYRDGEFGKIVNGTWIPLTVFSGTEQAVAFAAIASALAHNSPLKLVLLDEMGRLDRENKRKFIANMIELVNKGVVDQFIGIDTDPAVYDGGPVVTLIRTEK